MKFKKLVSAISALALVMSTFVGLGITAQADIGYSENFESYEVGATGAGGWTSGNTGRYTALVAEADGNKYLNVAAVGNGNNGTSVSTSSTTVAAGTDYTLSFDMALTRSTNQSSSFAIYAANGSELITIKQSAANSNTYFINNSAFGINYTLTNDTWYHYEVTVKDSRAFLSIKNLNDNTTILSTTNIPYSECVGGGLSKLTYNTGRYSAGMKMDNISIAASSMDMDTAIIWLATAPYATVTVGDKTYYSDYQGKVCLGDFDAGTVLNYTISKGGYTDTSGSYTVGSSDYEISAPLSINHHLYYEDFEVGSVFNNVELSKTIVTVPNGGVSAKVSGGRMYANTTASGIRKSYFSLGISETSFKATMSVKTSHGDYGSFDCDVVLTDSTNNPIAIIKMAYDGTLTFGQGSYGKTNDVSTITGTSGSTTYTVGTAFDVEIIQDETTNTLTITANGTTATVEGITPRALSRLTLTPGRSHTIDVDNIVIDRYPQYTITAVSDEKATVTPDVLTAGAGDTVKVTAEANSGYVLSGAPKVVKTSDGETEVTGNEDGTYSFVMPADDVTVTAVTMRPPGYIKSGFASAGTVSGTSIADADGVDIHVETKSTDYDTISIQPISWDGKAIAFTFTSYDNTNSLGDLKIVDNDKIERLVLERYNGWRIGTNTGSGFQNSRPRFGDQPAATEIVIKMNGNSLEVYANGKLSNGGFTNNLYSPRSISAIKVRASDGKTFKIDLDDFRIIDMPATYTVTGGGVAGTYIAGKEITLGTSTTGYWTDGTNWYPSGATYTVTSDVTFDDVEWTVGAYYGKTTIKNPEDPEDTETITNALRFMAKPVTTSGNPFATSNYGFVFTNFSNSTWTDSYRSTYTLPTDTANTVRSVNVADGKTSLPSGGTFHYDITGLGDTTYHVMMYAVPYILRDSKIIAWGPAFTYTENGGQIN